jgi:hypothetical protein
MDRVPGGEEVASLIPAVDLGARVVYFPVRHHSPACAWHVGRLIREVRPQSVLIEGPRDATPLIPFLTHADTRLPVAIYTTYVRRGEGGTPHRRAAYYPLCDYSPELEAIRAAAEVGAEARFIDLTFPEMVHAEHGRQEQGARSLFDEHHLTHGRLLKAACQRAGVRDPDDLWDHLYETDYTRRDRAEFIRGVLTYCALGRRDYSAEMLAAEGCDAREQAMAAAVAEARGRVVVVTGGFHTVALPATKPKMPKPVTADPQDAQVVLMRYGFPQLDRLNGYASGMPSPEFYQRLWEGRDVAEILVEVGRQCRKKGLTVSPADAIAALHHTRRLARLRGHAHPSREDVLDGVRSVFVKGAEDVEGVLVLSLARKLLAGDRVGDVPPEAGQPPIVHDFRSTAARLRLDLDRATGKEIALDLYRQVRAREVSRFLHRLRFLEVPFADWKAGPDFVSGEHLERIQEVWNYHWSPDVESTLIERSLYGSTLEEAATARLLEEFGRAEDQGQGRRADLATRLVLEACRMGLHRHLQDLLERTGRLVAEDPRFVSLVHALEDLLVLNVSREPLEAHQLTGVGDLAEAAYRRACYLLPSLAVTPEPEETEALDALNALYQAAQTLGDVEERRALRWHGLDELVRGTGGSAVLRGAASGLLFADGQLPPDDLVARLRGHLLSPKEAGKEGPAFLRGLLRTARSVLWHVPEVLASLHEVLRTWEDGHFVRQLPHLRLAFADLTPREADRVARAVAAQAGASDLRVATVTDFAEGDLLRAAEVNRLVRAALARDGLEAFGG